MEAIRTAPDTSPGDVEFDGLPGWYDRAACIGMDTGEFFVSVPRGQKPVHTTALEACRACPVVDPCRAYALADPSLYGVWGGTTEADRDRLRRERGAS